MAELLLDLLALDELGIVDDQEIDAAQSLLEGERRLRLQGSDEAVHEAISRQIDDAAARGANLVGDRLEEMRLAEADASMKVERVVQICAALVPGDALGSGVRQIVATCRR